MGLFDWMADQIIDAKVRRMLKDPYTDNLFMMVTTLQKVTPHILMETVMRAKQGGKVQRPLGSVAHWSPWEDLLFSPTYLTRVPPAYGTPIDLRATIGPGARKPLTVELPVLVAGMSFGGALSVNAKVALAKGASAAGTATNSGEAFLPEERKAADKLIVQYIRGTWPKSSQYRWDVLATADAIEIQIGQGAQAGTPQRTRAKNIHARMRETYGLRPGEDALIESSLKDVQRPEDLQALVKKLKTRFPVPVGFKFGATHWQERELEIAVRAGVDFVVVDGAEAGTHAASPTLEDDTGLPTFHALVRTVNYLKARGVRDGISVIAAGGLRTPGEYAKALALGADAVYIGTVALMALIADQVTKTIPGEPSAQLVLQAGALRDRLSVEQAARDLHRYLEATAAELRQVVTAVGKTRSRDLAREDLVAMKPWIAEFAGVPLATKPPSPDIGPMPELAGREERPEASRDRGAPSDERPAPSREPVPVGASAGGSVDGTANGTLDGRR